jgi:hypothetical protein
MEEFYMSRTMREKLDLWLPQVLQDVHKKTDRIYRWKTNLTDPDFYVQLYPDAHMVDITIRMGDLKECQFDSVVVVVLADKKNAAKRKRICPHCELGEVGLQASFCPYCGKELPDISIEEDVPKRFKQQFTYSHNTRVSTWDSNSVPDDTLTARITGLPPEIRKLSQLSLEFEPNP